MALNAGSEPVAEAEVELRRQRQERLSRALGQLLLRGYRMLGSCCRHCGTILVQDKQGQLLCVGCRECDGEGGTAPSPSPPLPAAPRPEHCEGAASALLRCPPPTPPPLACPPSSPPQPGADFGEGAVLAARQAVLAKLGWAAQELPRTGSAEGSAQLCALVRACADALGGLQALAGGAPALAGGAPALAGGAQPSGPP